LTRMRTPIPFISLIGLTLLVMGGLAATAASPLSGTFEAGIAFTPTATTITDFIQTDSDTYMRSIFNYNTDGWTFTSDSTLDVSGVTRQEFSASGALGLFIINSRLTFFPVLGSHASLMTYSNSVNSPSHIYDLGHLYFVDWVSATGVKVSSPTTHWYIRVSQDKATWETVSQEFKGNGVSGQVSVSQLARYIQIYATDGSSVYVDESTITASVSGNAWVTTAHLVAGGVTLDTSFTKATGGSNASLTISGTQDETLSSSITVYFKLTDPSCSFCLDHVQGTIGFDFGCIKDITTTWKLSSSGFEELSFSVSNIDIGLPGITLDGRVSFALLAKTVTLTPKLTLGNNTCFTIYAGLESGTGTPTEITGVNIYGLGLSYTWKGISIESLSYLDGLHHVKDTYWERFTIKSTGDSCCGGNLAFETSAYFQEAHSTLFDWAETDIGLSIGLGNSTTISTSIVVDTTGFAEWKIGWKASW